MDLRAYQKKVDNALDHLQSEFMWLQVGKASPALVENITVDASYGQMKVNQIGHVTVMDSQTIKIECRDKWELKHVEKAIYDANIGLTPQNEWGQLFIKIPPLTQERRQEVVKQVKMEWEETKAQIRRIRQDAMNETADLLKDKEISEDMNEVNEENVEAMIKKANTRIDDMVKEKSDDVLKM